MLMHSLILGNLCEYRQKSYITKTRFYIFVADSIGLSSTTLTLLAPKATEFCGTTQNNGHHAIQGHLRSAISVPTCFIAAYVFTCVCAFSFKGLCPK